MKKIETSLKTLAALAAVLCLLSGPASADPTVANIGVDTDEETLLVDGILVGGFTESIREAIESGVPLTFSYYIELRQVVPFFGDTLIGENTVRHTIQYDSLKKIYQYESFGRNINQKVITHNRSRSQKLMTTLNDIPLAPLNKLDPNEKYYVRVKAELEADEFFFPFNYLLFFLPFGGFETSWSETSPLIIDPAPIPSLEASQKSAPGTSTRPTQSIIRSFNQ